MSVLSQLSVMGASIFIPGPIWYTGPNLTNSHGQGAACGGITAGLIFGGSTMSEKLNGVSWSNSGFSVYASRVSLSGLGTQVAAVAFGGFTALTSSETYNGTAWAASFSLVTGMRGGSGCGIQTAGLRIGGGNNTIMLATTEKFNGTNWSSLAASLGNPRGAQGSSGEQNSVITFGGVITGGTVLKESEIWNGTVWSYAPSMAVARNYISGAGLSRDAALAIGGYNTDYLYSCETYNGTAWSAAGTKTLLSYNGVNAGSNVAAFSVMSPNTEFYS